MREGSDRLVRLCEGGSVSVRLAPDQRNEIEDAARWWQEANRLRQPPLWFAGSKSERLHAAQNLAGVVEAAGVSIELYPKLDASLLGHNAVPGVGQARTALSSLLWMMEMGEHHDLLEAGFGALAEAPATFYDLWSILLGANLLHELGNGVARIYQSEEGDLTTVRGRIHVARQVTNNWNRIDRIACVWDEFTPDTPLNRLFKCACTFLRRRVSHSRALQLLDECIGQLDEVEDVPVVTALVQTAHLRFNRGTERFRKAFELARRLLCGVGHEMQAASSNTFVFLVDMAQVFENYVHAVLEAHYGVGVTEQQFVGRLFPDLRVGGIHQYADYCWRLDSSFYIGDAKYKHLTSGSDKPLRFRDLSNESAISTTIADKATLAGSVLNAADVRQLTVYAELARRKTALAPSNKPISLLLLYPFLGEQPKRDATKSWSGDTFELVPVAIHRRERVADCLPH